MAFSELQPLGMGRTLLWGCSPGRDWPGWEPAGESPLPTEGLGAGCSSLLSEWDPVGPSHHVATGAILSLSGLCTFILAHCT